MKPVNVLAVRRRHGKVICAVLLVCFGLCQPGVLRANEAEKAVKKLRKEVKADPSNAELHYKLGRALSDWGRFLLQRSGRLKSDAVFREAITEYQKTVELQPSKVEARQSLASELAFQGKLAEARVQLCAIAKLNPDDSSAHLALARSDLHEEGGDLDEAIAELHTVLDQDAKNTSAWTDLGDAQMRVGKFEDAAAAYREALKQRPNSDTAHYNLGEALKRAGHMNEAVEEYREAVRLNAQWKDMLTTILTADLSAKKRVFAESDAQILQKLGYSIDPQLLEQLKSLQETAD